MEEQKERPVFRNLRIDTARYQYLGLWEELRIPPPLPPRRCHHSSVMIDNKMYIYGGQDVHIGVLGDLWVLTIDPSSSPNEIWTELHPSGDLPGPLCRHSAISRGNLIYLFGGTNNSVENNSIYILNTQTLVFTKINTSSDVPPALDSHSACFNEIDNTMIIFGGYINGIHSNELYIYNIQTNEWSHPNSQRKPEPRSDHSAIIYQNYMWIYGGSSESERLSDFWRLNLRNLQWELVQAEGNSPGTVSGHSVCVCGDVMLVFGGIREIIKETNSMYTYDFSSNRWLMIQHETQIKDPLSPGEIENYRKLAKQRHTVQYTNKEESAKADLTKQRSAVVGAQTQGRVKGIVPHSRDGHSAIVFEGGMYVFAGDRHQMSFNDVYCYSIQEQVLKTPVAI